MPLNVKNTAFFLDFYAILWYNNLVEYNNILFFNK